MYAYFNAIGWEHATVSLIQEYENISKRELLLEERRLINEHIDDCCWNIPSPIQTAEERTTYANAMNKAYRERNPLENKQRVKEWYDQNKEAKMEKLQEWRHANRNRVNEQQRRRRMEKKTDEQLAHPQSGDV